MGLSRQRCWHDRQPGPDINQGSSVVRYDKCMTSQRSAGRVPLAPLLIVPLLCWSAGAFADDNAPAQTPAPSVPAPSGTAPPDEPATDDAAPEQWAIHGQSTFTGQFQ